MPLFPFNFGSRSSSSNGDNRSNDSNPEGDRGRGRQSSISQYPGNRVSNNNNNNSSRPLLSSMNNSSSTNYNPNNNNSYADLPNHSFRRNDPYVSNPNPNPSVSRSQSQSIVRGSNVPGPTRISLPGLPPRTNLSSNSLPYVTNSNTTNNTSSHFNRNSNVVTTNNNNNNNMVTNSADGPTAQRRPGAYAVSRSTPSGAPSSMYRVTVPQGVVPGSEFTVHAGNRRVRVLCPTTSRPGQSLQITLPPEPTTLSKHLSQAPLTRCILLESDPEEEMFLRRDTPGGGAGGGAVEMSREVINVNKAAAAGGGTARTYLVTIPENVRPGQKFEARVDGQRFEVTCPSNAGPGRKVRIVAPQKPPSPPPEPTAAPKTQVYEVVVPNGVRPNQPFTLMANNQRVLVTCPPNVHAGSKIRFQLPVPATDKEDKPEIRLAYKDGNGSFGWQRTIRVSDMKFQWVHVDDDNDENKSKHEKRKSDKNSESSNTGTGTGTGGTTTEATFDFIKKGFVADLRFMEGNDARMRTGVLKLVPPADALVDSKYTDRNYLGTEQSKTLITYMDIEKIQSQPLDQKLSWFRKSVCDELVRPWEQGHINIVVRREHLLADSVDAVMSLGREDMRKRWRIEFSGEPGIEAGGLTREWFELVTEQIFDVNFGLWSFGVNNQMSMTINPSSYFVDEDLRYFRFLGRIMGRALFDGQLIKGHMSRFLYKHLLGWPITFQDLESQDEEYYKALKNLCKVDDISALFIDFTINEPEFGSRKTIDLVPNGSEIDVTNENLTQYLDAALKYKMLNNCKPQITELMLGFHDVIPASALTVFDPNELELILCGLPTIDMDDWMNNTKYSGFCEAEGRSNTVVKWFWEVANDFDQEMRARLLQFATGTSGVPPEGFSVLQGTDGKIKHFRIHGVSRDQYVYPRAHTCFNRIDLPGYTSKKELKERLTQAVSMTYVGFDME